MSSSIEAADKSVKRVQRYARLVRDQGSRAMPKLEESLRELMRQLDVIHEETTLIRTEPGAISPYGHTRIREADRALDDLHRFVRDPQAFAKHARVRYGFDLGGPDDLAIRASDVAANAFQGVRAARTIVASAARRDRHRDPERGRFSKKALWKDIEQDERKRRRANVERLRREAAEARNVRRQARERARQKCIRDRKRARLAAERIRARAEARAKKRLDDARQACALGKAYATSTRETVAATRAALEAERAYQREMRAIERSARSRTTSRLAKTRGGYFPGPRGPGPARARAREVMSESDDEVRQNIDPSLHALFERVKRGIRATPRMSRTEAFMQYVEEHPREADEAIEDATDALIRQLERRQRTGS